MKIIKIVLTVSSAIIFLWAFRNRYRVELRAGARIFAFLLTALAIISILIPNVTQELADIVGVTRGTDLLLYVLVVVFAATSTGTYFRFREVDRTLASIVRANAIRDACLTYGVPGGSG